MGEVKKQHEQALFEKFNVVNTPTLMALTDPNNYIGEIYDTNEMKID